MLVVAERAAEVFIVLPFPAGGVGLSDGLEEFHEVHSDEAEHRTRHL
jgi:hypothetical protein